VLHEWQWRTSGTMGGAGAGAEARAANLAVGDGDRCARGAWPLRRGRTELGVRHGRALQRDTHFVSSV
jgi:hypothetical protein